MKCSIREMSVDYHYTVWYDKRNLGDIFFHPATLECNIRFYGWGTGIILADLMEILKEIVVLEQQVKERAT